MTPGEAGKVRPRFGFRSAQRLRSRDIGLLLKAGRPRRAAAISVTSRTNGLGTARMAVVVPKRHLNRAVDRNRVKRLVREWFRTNQELFSGHDLLIRVFSRPVRFEALCEQLQLLLVQKGKQGR